MCVGLKFNAPPTHQEWDVGRHDWVVSDTGVAPEGRGLKMHSSGKKQIAVGMHAYLTL